MNLPKYLLADNTDCPDDIFILHTEYPRFIINLVDDEIEWLEDLVNDSQSSLENEVQLLIEEASSFYDREMQRYESN